MATWIKADGTTVTVRSKARRWSLAELQMLVGGDIEYMPGVAPLVMVMDEGGRQRQKPVNQLATILVRERLAEIGQPLRYVPTIVGDVVVMDPKER
jgi:hypothetical protein